MSYLVLARKYRPQSFEDLVGQEHVSQTLGNAIKTGRVHHAFLFTGARGVGKTSAARIFAKALNCEQGLSSQPCNVCQSCLEISSGQGLDVFEIDGASNTGVDDVRELRENIRYLPSRSRYKIFIIDEVHMLSINAFNALLKTLEEPPSHAKFIFATTEPHKIPITILSRCQRFDFRKIPLPLIITRLKEIASAENIQVSERSLGLVARRGEGSMRDALSTFDQVIAFCGETVGDEDVQGLLGMVDRRLLLDTLEGILGHDSRRVLQSVRRVDDLGHSFRQFCRELVEAFRSLVVLKVVPDPEGLLDGAPDELEELRRLAGAVELEDLERAVTVLIRTEGDLAGSSFPRLALEMALVRLAHLPAGREVATLVRQMEDLQRRLDSKAPVVERPATTSFERPVASSADRSPTANPEKPVPGNVEQVAATAPPVGVRTPPVGEVSPDGDGRHGWQDLVQLVRKERPRLGGVLEHGRLLVLDLPVVELGFVEGSFHLLQMQGAELQTAFSKIAEDFFGQSISLKVVALREQDQADVPPSLAEERQARESTQRNRVRDEALAHPGIQAVQKILGGDVVQVKPLRGGTDLEHKDRK
jgi:DNA polymerase-3 subunit gamma/tau